MPICAYTVVASNSARGSTATFDYPGLVPSRTENCFLVMPAALARSPLAVPQDSPTTRRPTAMTWSGPLGA